MSQFLDDGGSCPVTEQLGDDAGPLRRCSCGVWFRKGKWNQTSCSKQCSDRAYNAAHPVSRQRSIDFTPAPAPLPPVVDQRVPIPDCEGLKGQNAAVLARLRLGPATTRELAMVIPESLAIHSRVSDVREYLEGLGETVQRHRLGPRLHLYMIEVKA